MDETCARCGGLRHWTGSRWRCSACFNRWQAERRSRLTPEQRAAVTAAQTAGRRNWSPDRRAAEYARVHEWRERNRQYTRRQERERYKANAEALREAKMAAYWRNPDPFMARNLVRKARLIDAVCSHGPKCVDAEFLRSLKPQACIYCGAPFEAADHFQPLAKGGLHCRENLVPACAPCNSSKKDRDPMEFLADRGLLA